jgi:NAD(P)-dependent dehydrogenase (short-subunit alcohol dehydrogenase family)
MKIIITGHYSGIGKAIFKKFSKENYDCYGYDILNEKDLLNETTYNELIQQCNYADIFINCVYFPRQTELLKEVYSLWQNQNKIIVNLSSAVTYFYSKTDYPENFKNYYEIKEEQNIFVKSVAKNRNPYIMNIQPAWVDTQFAKDFDGFKISTNDLANLIYFYVKNKEKYQIVDIVII